MLCLFFATQSNAQLRIGAGASVGAGSNEVLTGVNISAVYVGEGSIDFGAAYTYWFADQTFMSVDLDVYYLMKIAGADDDIYISPFAGLNVAKNDRFSSENPLGADTSINLGLSIKKEIGDRMFFLEPKVLLGYPDFVVKAGLLF